MQCQQGKCRHHYEGQGYYNYPLLNYATFNGNFTLAVLEGGKAGADLGGGCRGAHPSPPWDDLRFSNTTGILQKTMSFTGVEEEQETSAPPPEKNPGSAPEKYIGTSAYNDR